jgi:serine/threonine protein phosphatase PrpC
MQTTCAVALKRTVKMEMDMEHGLIECLKRITGKGIREASMTPVVSEKNEQNSKPLPSANKAMNVTRVLQPVHTLRLRPEPHDKVPAEIPGLAPVWYGITDTGGIRDHNEDNFAVLELAGKVLFIVADGMGGHDAGEVASRIAVDTVCRVVQEKHNLSTDHRGLVERAVQEANSAVLEEGARKGSDMGTTLSMALVANDIAYVASVGDSRVYWMENGSISQITSDHSLVAKLVAAGRLTKEEARNHPRSNLLFRTIGTDETVKVDTACVKLKKGGTLLLCTDGLWSEVTDEDIHEICTREKSVESAGTRLVQVANENGGKDNITAIVARVV